MALNNRGKVGNTSNPEGHTHSIHEITDISTGGQDGDFLVQSNDIWVAHQASPYVMAAGTYTWPNALTIAAGGNSGALSISYATVFGIATKFTLPPVVTVTIASNYASMANCVLHIGSSSTTGFNLYIYNAGSSSTTIAAGTFSISFIAAQMTVLDASTIVSRNPGA
jgi:hypothetical protein